MYWYVKLNVSKIYKIIIHYPSWPCNKRTTHVMPKKKKKKEKKLGLLKKIAGLWDPGQHTE